MAQNWYDYKKENPNATFREYTDEIKASQTPEDIEQIRKENAYRDADRGSIMAGILGLESGADLFGVLHNTHSGINAITSGNSWNDESRELERRKNQAWEDHPVAYGTGYGTGLVGSAAVPLGTAAKIAKGASAAKPLAGRALAEGAAFAAGEHGNELARNQKSVFSDASGYGKSAATGAATGYAVNKLVGSKAGQAFADKLNSVIMRGREIAADVLPKKTSYPLGREGSEEGTAAMKFAEGFDARRDRVEDIRNAISAEGQELNKAGREVPAFEDLRPDEIEIYNLAKDNKWNLKKTLKPLEDEIANAKKSVDNFKKSANEVKMSEAQERLADLQGSYDRQAARLSELKALDDYGVMVGKYNPNAKSAVEMSNINPARKYSEETGAIRGSEERGPSDEFARVYGNSGREDKLPNQRAMWQGDLILRDMVRNGEITEKQANEIFSYAAKGTRDEKTGTGILREVDEQASQGEKFAGGWKEIENAVRAGENVDSAIARGLRGGGIDYSEFNRLPEETRRSIIEAVEGKQGDSVAQKAKSDAGEVAGNVAPALAGEAVAHLAGYGLGVGAAGGVALKYGGKIAGRAAKGAVQRAERNPISAARKFEKALEDARITNKNGERINIVRQSPIAENAAKGASARYSAGLMGSDESAGTEMESRNAERPEKSEIPEDVENVEKRIPAGAIDENLSEGRRGAQSQEGMPSGVQIRQSLAPESGESSSDAFWRVLGSIGKVLAAFGGIDLDISGGDRYEAARGWGYSKAAAMAIASDADAFAKEAAKREGMQTAARDIGVTKLDNGETVFYDKKTGDIVRREGGGAAGKKYSAQQVKQLGDLRKEERGVMANDNQINILEKYIQNSGDTYVGSVGRSRFELDSLLYSIGQLPKNRERAFIAAKTAADYATQLQAKLAKDLTSRGSDMAIRIARESIPSPFKPLGVNREHLHSLRSGNKELKRLIDIDKKDVMELQGMQSFSLNGD